jgi:hypothetical protein
LVIVPPETTSCTCTGPHWVWATVPVTVAVLPAFFEPEDAFVPLEVRAELPGEALLPLPPDPSLVVPDTKGVAAVRGEPVPWREASKPKRRTTAETVERIQKEIRRIATS